MYKQLHDYEVVLSNCHKQDKTRVIKSCVSKSAAANVANILERIEARADRYWSRLAYQLDENNRRIFI